MQVSFKILFYRITAELIHSWCFFLISAWKGKPLTYLLQRNWNVTVFFYCEHTKRNSEKNPKSINFNNWLINVIDFFWSRKRVLLKSPTTDPPTTDQPITGHSYINTPTHRPINHRPSNHRPTNTILFQRLDYIERYSFYTNTTGKM